MKKIFISITAACIIVGASSCLKDKGFENEKYGMQNRSAKGVSFPESISSPIIGAITAQPTPVIVQGPFIALEHAGAATSNVRVIVAENNALLPGTITALPAGTYTTNAGTIVIAAGQRSSNALRITITNSMVLDPTKVYGVGFTISSADEGYTVASNQKNVVIAFSIKNKYDGVYTLNIKTVGWGVHGIADGVSGQFPGNIHLITQNETTVSMRNTENNNFLQPAFTGGVGALGSATVFGATTPVFVFNRTTDALVEVRNTTADDGRGRVLLLNPAVTNSRFDAATRAIYAAYIMKQNGRADQFIYDTLTFVRDRE